MKILSYNVRGLGSNVKRREIKDLIRNHIIEFCSIQETKMEVISDSTCKTIMERRKIRVDFQRSGRKIRRYTFNLEF
ncbi:hypothetical protein ACS0TY_026164 [Phlomoides rotata]